ncbi:DUF3109 family protein [Marinilongibacter aquaticus]|uniref:DUF3109 family protein n=1 Tax=Marinilongibacter aquaticus TaxID=2975157 RepID=UPI0021BD6A14|nr:DUF3109 family protein [Marinilongibacter aquaticus]UBM60147.1 DUF3109 family protein [Marinilongibacter aquaticus]
MILIEDTVISDDIKEKEFVCNLEKCKGACCIEGDLGAPLEEIELKVLQDEFEAIAPFLSPEGLEAIREQGLYIEDEEGDFSTPTIAGRECAYVVYDKNGCLKCGIEDAYNAGKTDFKKPISCHLYPIRVTKYEQYHALNYDQWSICSDACTLGKELQVPVYKFLKEPLERAYGEEWYAQLVEEIEGE